MSKVSTHWRECGADFSEYLGISKILSLVKEGNTEFLEITSPTYFYTLKTKNFAEDSQTIYRMFEAVLEETIKFFSYNIQVEPTVDLESIRERVYEKARMSLSCGTANDIADEVMK